MVTFTFTHDGKDYIWNLSDHEFVAAYDEGVAMANAFLKASGDMLSDANQKKAQNIIKAHVFKILLGIDVECS